MSSSSMTPPIKPPTIAPTGKADEDDMAATIVVENDASIVVVVIVVAILVEAVDGSIDVCDSDPTILGNDAVGELVVATSLIVIVAMLDTIVVVVCKDALGFVAIVTTGIGAGALIHPVNCEPH